MRFWKIRIWTVQWIEENEFGDLVATVEVFKTYRSAMNRVISLTNDTFRKWHGVVSMGEYSI